MSKFIFVSASLLMLILSLFPHSKNVIVHFMRGKKILMEEKCVTEVLFWIRM